MSYAVEIRNGIHVQMAVQFPAGDGEWPERLFMSRPLIGLIMKEEPKSLTVDPEGILFDGTRVIPYEAEEPEYYPAFRRGEFYNFQEV